MNYKTIFVTSNFVPVNGGIAHFIYQIVRFFPTDTTRVIALPTPGHENVDAELDIDVLRLNIPRQWRASSGAFKFLWPVYLYRLLCIHGAQYLVCDNAHHTLMLPAWIVSRITGGKFIVFAHGTDIMRPQKRIWGRLLNYLMRKADLIVTNSVATLKTVEALGVNTCRLTVVHPPIDPEKYQLFADVSELRRQHGLHAKKCILTVARLVERKGIDTVICALPKIINELPEVHYMIVGDGDYRNVLESLAFEHGVQDHVTFAGHATDTEVQQYFSMCDVFVMASRSLGNGEDAEGFGIVYLEANLYGKPVIGCDSGGVRDAIVNGVTGVLVDDCSSDKIAAAAINLLTDNHYAEKLGTAGRERVLNEFSAKYTSERFQQMLYQLVV